MSKCVGKLLIGITAAFSFFAIALSSAFVSAQNLNNFGNQVGGVKIDANGVVDVAPVEMRQDLSRLLKKNSKPSVDDLQKNTEMRMISLRNLEQAIGAAIRNGNGELSEEIQYLAGIQRVEYVFLFPEENDIVLAGPGEGWIVDENGNVVGETTGLPVVQLQDLLIAMRTVNNAREGYGISCSIDPTEEGRVRFRGYMKNQKQFTPQVIRGAEEALGMQLITLTGVPTDSHFAAVLVAADYKMKRIAMHLEETPVKEIPSFLTIMQQKRAKLTNMMPRWWLACNYEPLSRSADGLAWRLNGPGVKAMTEDEIISAEGKVAGTGQANPIAQMWADKMTAYYDELSKAEPIFGDLRNIMDLSVVAALIEKEKMLDKVNLRLPNITTDQSAVAIVKYNVPKTVQTQCSYMKIKGGTLITASGGVQIESWAVTEHVENDVTVSKKRELAKPHDGVAWYWN